MNWYRLSISTIFSSRWIGIDCQYRPYFQVGELTLTVDINCDKSTCQLNSNRLIDDTCVHFDCLCALSHRFKGVSREKKLTNNLMGVIVLPTYNYDHQEVCGSLWTVVVRWQQVKSRICWTDGQPGFGNAYISITHIVVQCVKLLPALHVLYVQCEKQTFTHMYRRQKDTSLDWQSSFTGTTCLLWIKYCNYNTLWTFLRIVAYLAQSCDRDEIQSTPPWSAGQPQEKSTKKHPCKVSTQQQHTHHPTNPPRWFAQLDSRSAPLLCPYSHPVV